MRETKSQKIEKLGRDLRLLVDFLNFEFQTPYKKMSKQSIPSTWLRWFLAGHGLDNPEGWKKAKKIQEAVQRDLVPIVSMRPGQRPRDEELLAKFDRLPKPMWEWDAGEAGLSVAMMHVDSGSPKEYLYTAILSALLKRQFKFVRRCQNCGKYFFGATKYCGSDCLKLHHDGTASRRSNDSRERRKQKELKEVETRIHRMQQIKKEWKIDDPLDLRYKF